MNTPKEFMEYFRANYPGPNTIISNPDWHAPRIYAAAIHASEAADLRWRCYAESLLLECCGFLRIGREFGWNEKEALAIEEKIGRLFGVTEPLITKTEFDKMIEEG